MTEGLGLSNAVSSVENTYGTQKTRKQRCPLLSVLLLASMLKLEGHALTQTRGLHWQHSTIGMFENYKFCCEQKFAVHAYQENKEEEEEEFASCTCMVIPFCRCRHFL